MENTITLCSIRELLDKNFYIPSYQRGYRWEKQQIDDLLNDIEEFDNTKDGEFYCLQPLVVKANDAGRWNIIDGQQRLTTIYLILRYLKEEGDKEIQLQYHREKHLENLRKLKVEIPNKIFHWGDFISNEWHRFLTDNQESDNIEFYHLFVAVFSITNWFIDKPQALRNNMKERLLSETKFIWCNVGDSDEHKLFKNLNSGKIALTNAELIKALFLNSTGLELFGKELRQNLLAEEYDQMERTLREDDFWYFLAGNQTKYSSCINLLFNLMLESADETFNDLKEVKDPLRTFFYFKQILLRDNNCNKITDDEQLYLRAVKIWKEVQTYFYTLQGWYKNAEIFNLIGFLRALKEPISLKTIWEKWEHAPDKVAFVNELKELSKPEICYEDENYLELNYKSPNTRNLLLLLNIATLLNKPGEKIRFSFSDFHKYEWDIEHISPQNPKSIEEFIEKNGAEKLPSELKEWNKLDDFKKRELINIYTTSNPDVLENLTLLSAHDNRGIGNKYFFEKREFLKRYFQEGSFIPACSINVFVKFYTTNPENLNFWNQVEDGKDYLRFIEATIEKFFNLEVKNG